MRVVVTCANILTSQRSSMAHAFAFTADANTLLPLVSFFKDPSFKKTEKKLLLNSLGVERETGFEPATSSKYSDPMSLQILAFYQLNYSRSLSRLKNIYRVKRDSLFTSVRDGRAGRIRTSNLLQYDGYLIRHRRAIHCATARQTFPSY